MVGHSDLIVTGKSGSKLPVEHGYVLALRLTFRLEKKEREWGKEKECKRHFWRDE